MYQDYLIVEFQFQYESLLCTWYLVHYTIKDLYFVLRTWYIVQLIT